jgi:hypothetical protein
MRRACDCCPEDGRTFACWICLGSDCTCDALPDDGDGPEYDKDDGWSRAQEAEMYGHE